MTQPRQPLLRCPGWHPPTRRKLEQLIRRGSGRRWPVAFDFDNTLVCGDIGEATLAVLAASGRIHSRSVAGHHSPTFVTENGSPAGPDHGPDITAYYEALLAPTAHGSRDATPLANGYVWAVEAMAGLTAREVVEAAAAAHAAAQPGQIRHIHVTPGHTSYPAPYFHPEMVELLGALLRHQFDVWIVSASNVWSVRYMVRRVLTPLLQAQGIQQTIPPDHVIGVSVLLTDSQGRLYKDANLVREDQRYAALDSRRLGQLRLTTKLQFPVPTYSGKVACLWDALGQPPCLAAGDSPGDLAMLAFSKHRLWIARLDKPDYQRTALARGQSALRDAWWVQPTLGKERPGFLPDLAVPQGVSPKLQALAHRSLKALK